MVQLAVVAAWLGCAVASCGAAPGAATCRGGSCDLDESSAGTHLLQAGAAVWRQKADLNVSHSESHNVSQVKKHGKLATLHRNSTTGKDLVNVSIDEEESEQKEGRCTTTTCLCHRLHIGSSLLLSSAIAFLMLTVVIGGCVGCNPGAGPASKSFYLQRAAIVSAVSLLLTVSGGYFLRRCYRGHLEFVHIPKNGGSSVEIAGIESGFYWGAKSLKLIGKQHFEDDVACNRYHVPPTLLEGRNPYRVGHTFCISRNPYDRAVSEYVFLLGSNWGKYYSEKYQQGLYDYPECTPEGLNHFLSTALQKYDSGSRYFDDCHHLPQTTYIFNKHGRRTCKDVLRLEEFPEAFDRLMQRHGYPVRLPQVQVLASEQVCEGLSTKALSEEVRQLIRKVYADDFRLLNYTM